MQKLILLFAIYLLFLSISFVMGYAAELALPAYAPITKAALLTLSSMAVLTLFFFDSGDAA